MRNNRGFSLVELIIGVAVISVLGSAITGFMIAGTKGYSSNSREINLQYEAQMTMNQISDYLIDCNEVDYDEGARVLKIVSGNSASANCVEHLIAQRGDILVYSQIKNGATVGPFPMSEYLAENGFIVDLSRVIGRSEKQVAGITLNFENKDRTYSMTTNVTLRNNVDGKYTSIEFADPQEATPDPTDVPEGWRMLRELPQGVAPGTTLMLTDYISNESAPMLNWSITGNTSSRTTIGETTGTLSISRDEKGVINIEVYNKSNPADKYTAVIPVAKVRNVEIEIVGSSARLYPGRIFTLAAKVTADPERYSEKFSSVKWEIESGSDILTAYGNGSFKINTTAAIGRTFGIRAVSKYDESVVSNVITGTVVRKTAEDSDPDDEDNDDDDNPTSDETDPSTGDSTGGGHTNPAGPDPDRPEDPLTGFIKKYKFDEDWTGGYHYKEITIHADIPEKLGLSNEQIELATVNAPSDIVYNANRYPLTIRAKNLDGGGSYGFNYSILKYVDGANVTWYLSIWREEGWRHEMDRLIYTEGAVNWRTAW